VAQPLALVVEDDPGIRVLYAKYLAELGFRVVSCDGGEPALAEIDKELPTLVCLDAMLPEVSGYAVCERIRSSEKTRGLKVLMISARSALADRVLAEEVGADLYLVKPVRWADFSAAVRSVMRPPSIR
jgi:DNA-binding response OmpR family regulator